MFESCARYSSTVLSLPQMTRDKVHVLFWVGFTDVLNSEFEKALVQEQSMKMFSP